MASSMRLTRRAASKASGEHLAGKRGTGQVLAEAIVQIVSDPTLFPFADFEDLSLQPLALVDLLTQCGGALLDAQLQIAQQQAQMVQ